MSGIGRVSGTDSTIPPTNKSVEDVGAQKSPDQTPESTGMGGAHVPPPPTPPLTTRRIADASESVRGKLGKITPPEAAARYSKDYARDRNAQDETEDPPQEEPEENRSH